MRTILTVPNAVLRQRCEPIGEIDAKVEALAKELCGLLSVEHGGLIYVSVSASQVGELLRMFAYRTNPYSREDSVQVVINPELVYSKGTATGSETCLSLPEKEYIVTRHKLVKIRGLTLDGTYRSFKGRGRIAQVFEHELNHLDGILIDRVGSESQGVGE